MFPNPDIMASRPHDSWAMKLTSFFLQCAGFWTTNSKFGKIVMVILRIYTIFGIFSSFVMTAIDIYMSFGDLSRFTYCSVNLFIVAFAMHKTISFIIKRKQFLDLAIYAKKYFWNIDYDDYGAAVMKKCMLQCTPIMILAAFMCHLTLIIHFIYPLIGNGGKNETDRILPFKFYSHLPITITPWYEMLYIIQILMSYTCCYSYYCFDNFLLQMNITIVGQFIILQKDMREICNHQDDTFLSNEYKIYLKFKKCVQKHQQLITCVENIKDLYSGVTLGVVILLSFLLCLEMFELMTARKNLLYTFHYCIYVLGSITQLYFFTSSCNNLTEASIALSDAAYDVPWFLMKSETLKNQLVKDLLMVILRSQRACSLTVGGFSPVTLQTFTSICNTAFSFLTLIRQSLQKND